MKERTPFGERLHKARTHARLTQSELAKAAGVSQGTLGELEWRYDGSAAVVRLAKACGVRAEWLAEGHGDMIDPEAWPFGLVSREEILALDERALGIVEGAMLSALDRIRGGPTDADMKVFRESHVRVSTKSQKRRSA